MKEFEPLTPMKKTRRPNSAAESYRCRVFFNTTKPLVENERKDSCSFVIDRKSRPFESFFPLPLTCAVRFRTFNHSDRESVLLRARIFLRKQGYDMRRYTFTEL